MDGILLINDPVCTAKTFPTYFDMLESKREVKKESRNACKDYVANIRKTRVDMLERTVVRPVNMSSWLTDLMGEIISPSWGIHCGCSNRNCC